MDTCSIWSVTFSQNREIIVWHTMGSTGDTRVYVGGNCGLFCPTVQMFIHPGSDMSFSLTNVRYTWITQAWELILLTNVVYKFSCSCDRSISYIGETRRQLFTRIKEHCTPGNNSAVFDHIQTCVPCQNSKISDRFEVLLHCTRYNILSAEAMLIARHRPVLNTQ